MAMVDAESPYFALMCGEEWTYECRCGRECPVRWCDQRDTLVLDHGGEAVFVMPQAEWQAVPLRGSFRLRDSSLTPWLERVHAFEEIRRLRALLSDERDSGAGRGGDER